MNDIERQTIRGFLNNNFNLYNCFGFTGDLKQYDKNYGYLDKIKVSMNTKRFLNYLNYKVYKNSFRRHNKRLKVIPTIEGGWKSDKRYHVHLVMELPDTNIISNKDFYSLFFNCWDKTYYSYSHPKVEQYIDHGWIDYITKFKEKDDFVDWDNTTV